jgi:uncharacterized protein with PQ loop repeat
MNQFYVIIGAIAGILAIVGYIPYIYNTLKGKTLPNRASWFIWTLVGGLLAFSYLAEGDQNTIWLPLAYFVGPLLVAILSLRYGYSKWTRLDTICIVAAVLSIIPWILSDNASFTLIINVLIDMFGALPTVYKSYFEPETEDFTAWLIFFIANILQVIAIQVWNIAAIYPIYLFFLAGSIVLFIVKDKLMNKVS